MLKIIEESGLMVVRAMLDKDDIEKILKKATITTSFVFKMALVS